MDNTAERLEEFINHYESLTDDNWLKKITQPIYDMNKEKLHEIHTRTYSHTEAQNRTGKTKENRQDRNGHEACRTEL